MVLFSMLPIRSNLNVKMLDYKFKSQHHYFLFCRFTWEKQTACHYLLSLRTQRSVSKILYFCCGRKLFVLPSAQRQPKNRSSNITNQDNCRIFAAVFRTLSFKTNRADQLKSRLSSTDNTACICIK